MMRTVYVIGHTHRNAVQYCMLRWRHDLKQPKDVFTRAMSSAYAVEALRGKRPALIVMMEQPGLFYTPELMAIVGALKASGTDVEWDTTDRLMGITR